MVNDTYQLVDGGIWANNPSLVAAIDAHYRLGIPLEDIRVLAIGTGKSTTFYPRSKSKWKDRLVWSWQGWGFATRWRGSKFIDLILNLQSDNAHNMLCLLLGESPLKTETGFATDVRVGPATTHGFDRKNDTTGLLKADHIFTHNASRIAAFLSIERSSN